MTEIFQLAVEFLGFFVTVYGFFYGCGYVDGCFKDHAEEGKDT